MSAHSISSLILHSVHCWKPHFSYLKNTIYHSGWWWQVSEANKLTNKHISKKINEEFPLSSSLLIQSSKSRYNTQHAQSYHTTLHIPRFRNLFLSFGFLPRWVVTLTIIFLSELSRAACILSSRRFTFLLRAAAVAHQHPEVTYVT